MAENDVSRADAQPRRPGKGEAVEAAEDEVESDNDDIKEEAA